MKRTSLFFARAMEDGMTIATEVDLGLGLLLGFLLSSGFKVYASPLEEGRGRSKKEKGSVSCW
jgi:hypothetical protein